MKIVEVEHHSYMEEEIKKIKYEKLKLEKENDVLKLKMDILLIDQNAQVKVVQ